LTYGRAYAIHALQRGTIKKTFMKRTRVTVDYDRLHALLLAGPLDYAAIRKATGLPNSGIVTVIDNLTLRYPLYRIRKGVYGLLEDGGDGKS
jgi:hypothetical protein